MNESMTLQLTDLSEYLRASHISRWGIVQTAVRQNIAEHSYRVWTMVRHLGREIGLSPEDQRHAEDLALLHDLPEIRTGDAPTPHKSPEVKAMLQSIEEEICPEAAEAEKACSPAARDLVKFCDTAESILFLEVNGLGRHAKDVQGLLTQQMKNRLADSFLHEEDKEKLINHFLIALSST